MLFTILHRLSKFTKQELIDAFDQLRCDVAFDRERLCIGQLLSSKSARGTVDQKQQYHESHVDLDGTRTNQKPDVTLIPPALLLYATSSRPRGGPCREPTTRLPCRFGCTLDP